MLSRTAFDIRFHLEMARVQLLNMERSKVEAGYSSFVEFSNYRWSSDEGFRGDVLEWKWTVSGLGESESTLPIRLPGITLRKGLITPKETMNPTEYARLWKEYRLDEYLRMRAELKALRVCLTASWNSRPSPTKIGPTAAQNAGVQPGPSGLERSGQNGSSITSGGTTHHSLESAYESDRGRSETWVVGMQRFSKRHNFGGPPPEITVREEAPESLRFTVLDAVERLDDWNPDAMRAVVCRVLHVPPNSYNWSQYPNICDEVQGSSMVPSGSRSTT